MKPYIWFRFLAAAARAQRDRWLARDPLGDYVPEEWVAEYRQQDRGQP